MLSGVVIGGIFASPSVHAVRAAIFAAAASNDNAGVLVIVKNYTGDRLSTYLVESPCWYHTEEDWLIGNEQ